MYPLNNPGGGVGGTVLLRKEETGIKREGGPNPKEEHAW